MNKTNIRNNKIDKNLFSNISNKFMNLFNNNEKPDKENPKLLINYFNNTKRVTNTRIKYDFYNLNTEEDNLNPINENLNSSIRTKHQKKSSLLAKSTKMEKEERLYKDNYISSLMQNQPKILKWYQSASNDKKLNFEYSLIYEVHVIIKEFIPHFANFNYEISEAMDLLVDLFTKYNLEKENISFYVTYLNSCYYSIKNKHGQKTENGYEISNSKREDDEINNDKLECIFKASNYFDKKSIFNILLLNKDFYLKYKKKIISNFIEKENETKINSNLDRINIWKSLLKIVQIILIFQCYKLFLINYYIYHLLLFT